MHGPSWGIANDALVVEGLLASTTDPVTSRATAVSLHAECARMRAEDAVLTVVTLAYDTATTHALRGRARGLDVAERALCRDLERWADPPGAVVAIGEAAVAYLVMSTAEDAQAIRGHLPELRAQVARGAGAVPCASAAQGPSRNSSDVMTRAVERLVMPGGVLPHQDHWAAGTARMRPLWDATTGRRFGTQVRLQAESLDDAEAERAEALLAVTRSPRCVDAVVAAHEALPQILAAHPDDSPLLWDVSAVLSGTGPAREVLAEILADRSPPGVWIGVAAWLAALDEVQQALRVLRTRGHRIVITRYGSGREPLAAFDELPIDAILLDPHLEAGARITAEDSAVLLATVEHAARNDVAVLSTSSTTADLHRSPAPVLPRTAAPGGQLLERARMVGLTLRQTAVLVNAVQGQGPTAARWDRYDVATHWALTSR
ncbi:EAL domain-containing protein [Cellulomonas dongxiuzhuiae]|uniref:EAL domain-containing protein n=1 Tax=Cellulomonas dongxiuzhuiae TaxID=2819979 RepID=A0ABX8GLR9_9CELL|nr:EAL domain-containing protein [Cellulomonas dongxiuzhuiae]MBO3096371.1 EAL domain-containing protein [Cellulomonas dongxiuzhuiae]QWC16783.1 EAL domain-containing protein [Cellulomonas dongxiuzhuiae]